MRLLLDEMLSPAIARELRERGHDVLAVPGHPGWVALSDPEVMALARTERRAVVTNNLRDYRPLHAEAMAALRAFDRWRIRSVPRAENARADELVNEALDADS